ncbi:MAG: GNAT family N-acetyltransferase [Deferribacteraceae bacterium]|jgi:spore coat polysaccharide biosynthesis predicted glycosyltransferase SpsG|nr:GNAT family N-acetyltransferase [Deferribacteraceae bacterium]
MSFVFLTEAGTNYGIGHMTRCDAIAQALHEQWESSVFIIDASSDIAQYLTHKTISCVKWQDNWPALSKIMNEINLTNSIEGIFVDSYHASRELLKKLAVFNTQLFFMDDYCRLEYPKGVIINPEFSAKKELYPVKNGRSVYAGIKYFPLRAPFWDTEVLPYIKRKGIVITLGGSGDQRCLDLIVENLKVNVSEPVILLSADYQIQSAYLSGNVIIINNRQNAEYMRTLISAARIIICGGGGTLIEAARTGTPAIVVKMADNQQNNVKAWTNHGFARYAGDKNSQDVGVNVLRYISELNDAAIWRETSDKGVAYVDGQGARRIAKIILGEARMMGKSVLLKNNYNIGGLYFKNFLHCTPYELEIVRNAQNSDFVRSGNINQRIMTLDNHQAFILNLGGSVTGAYWLAHNGETPVGVLSLAEIDWSLSHTTLGYYKLPDYPHKGVGKALVSAAKEITFNTLGLKTLTAECLKDNTASVKSMEAAGLNCICSQERQIDGGDIVIILKYESTAN